MKKFKFRFESVLTIRAKALDDRLLEMAQVQNRLNLAIEHLEQLYCELNETKIQSERMLENEKDIDITLIEAYRNYLLKLESDIKNQHKVITGIETELDNAKENVKEALKALKIMEKLKEKDFRQYIKDFEEAGFREIDEIAVNRFRKAV